MPLAGRKTAANTAAMPKPEPVEVSAPASGLSTDAVPLQKQSAYNKKSRRPRTHRTANGGWKKARTAIIIMWKMKKVSVTGFSDPGITQRRHNNGLYMDFLPDKTLRQVEKMFH